MKWGDLATLEYGRSLRGYEHSIGAIRVFGTNGPIGWTDEPLCPHETVVIGRKGAYRGIHFSDRPCFVIDTAFYLEPKTEFNMRWAYYQLLTHDIDSMDSGSAIPSTSRPEFYQLPVPVPPLTEQSAIANILGTLDDKIELNRRMNETLEAMARALFKSWFVDFDPVRAKMEGRQPVGMDAETAALFPSRLVESEIGEIPEGWEAGSILDIADLLSGGTPRTEVGEYWDGNVPWVSAKDVTAVNGLFVLDTERNVTQSGIENSSAQILPEFTTVVTARGTVGRYCLLGREMSMNQTNYGLRAKDKKSHLFVFFSLGSLVEELKQQSYGTIFDTITTATFKNTKVVVPPSIVVKKFEVDAMRLMGKVLNNLHESRTLAAVRDALLPKLMSGEVRVG